MPKFRRLELLKCEMLMLFFSEIKKSEAVIEHIVALSIHKPLCFPNYPLLTVM